ncbi:unnamed protein product [Phytomonas sp. Hart1]|nr:unnamed protein product [Phytomonas sp. Hart1]|eukprot:CCW68417.1 unnamed protein product [Phytomonas sp. isolate Hart1]
MIGPVLHLLQSSGLGCVFRCVDRKVPLMPFFLDI